MRDRLPSGRSPHRPAGIRLRARQPGAFPAAPGPLSAAVTGPRPRSIRTAPQRAAPIAAATAKNHSMPHPLHRVRAAANAVNTRRHCAGLLEPFPQACRVARMAASPARLEPWSRTGRRAPGRRNANWPGPSGRLGGSSPGRAARLTVRTEVRAGASFPSGDMATSSTWLVLAAVTQSRRPSQRCTSGGGPGTLTTGQRAPTPARGHPAGPPPEMPAADSAHSTASTIEQPSTARKSPK